MMITTTTLYVCLALLDFTAGRQIVFPPVDAFSTSQLRNKVRNNPHQHLSSSSGSDHPSIYEANAANKFFGLTTFANLPWAPCLHEANSTTLAQFDIAILGAPFDTATTFRPGARFGPGGIRRGSQRMDPDSHWSPYGGKNVFKQWATIIDCGDAPLTFLDNTIALVQLERAHRTIASTTANATTHSSVPRILALGGDHTTTLAALRSTVDHWGPVSVIHFDSHLDTWDPDVLGGDLSHFAGVNHGTFLHIAHEEGLLLNDTSIHAGTRGPASNPKRDWRNDARCGFDIITARDIDRFGVHGVIERIRRRVGDTNVYVSVDIDVLDPAFAPGTGTPDVGGWSTRELLSVLDGLAGVKVVGADVVEVAPVYDNAGETTVLAAAEVVLSLLELMVETPVKSMKDLATVASDT